MKIHKKFQKTLNIQERDAFFVRITENLPKEWRYDAERSNDSTIMSGDPSFVYIYSGKKFPKCALFFSTYQNILMVSNIVPMEISQLSMDQYNDILTDFVTRALPEETCNLSSETLDLSTIMSPDTIKKLDFFCRAANQSTGSGHPCDRERWNQFILSAFVTGDEQNIYEDTLKRILIEMYNWSEEIADELIHEYLFGVKLLRTCWNNGLLRI